MAGIDTSTCVGLLQQKLPDKGFQFRTSYGSQTGRNKTPL